MILLIDNYDSFTYNLYQLLAEMGKEVRVVRSDKITVEEIEALAPEGIVLSPGPGRPEEAGICLDAIRKFCSTTPILGVCLGQQAIGLVFGGDVVRAPEIVHGKADEIFHRREHLFASLPLPFKAARYHSLIVDRKTLPEELEVQAETAGGLIMALKHRSYPLYGVQFHPESILTPEGRKIIRAFLDVCEAKYVK